MHITFLPIFQDNYIWLLINDINNTVTAVDPGEASTLQRFLAAKSLRLTDILLTHHHADHIGGVLDLARHYKLNVYGPLQENIVGVTHNLQDNQEFFLENLDINFKVLAIPGHTLGHIAYYNSKYGVLFCGDTLFSAGCGRIFEGTPEQMYASLLRLNSLPDDTLIYCTHEYTLNNLKFAKSIEPDNLAIQNKILAVQDMLAKGLPSLPTKLKDERKYNPFLRCDKTTIVENLQKKFHINLNGDLQTFTYLRKLKDTF